MYALSAFPLLAVVDLSCFKGRQNISMSSEKCIISIWTLRCLPCPVKLLVKQNRLPCLFSKNLAVLVSALPEHSRAMWMFMAIAVVLNTRESYRKHRFFCFWTLFNSSANTLSWASCLSFVHAELLLGTGYIVFNFS